MKFLYSHSHDNVFETFEREFEVIKKAPRELQKQVIDMVQQDVEEMFHHSPRVLNSLAPKLLEKYEYLKRNTRLTASTLEVDPHYSYAFIMASVTLSIGDDATFNKVMMNVLDWFKAIGSL